MRFGIQALRDLEVNPGPRELLVYQPLLVEQAGSVCRPGWEGRHILQQKLQVRICIVLPASKSVSLPPGGESGLYCHR